MVLCSSCLLTMLLFKYIFFQLHNRGLLLGLQIDLSNTSCNGRPGSRGNYKRDASTLASWGVDYIKASACSFSNRDELDRG